MANFVGIALISIAATVGLLTPNRVAAQDWRGFYAGANLGGLDLLENGDRYCVSSGVVNGRGCTAVQRAGPLKGSGFVGGGQIGYNWQFGNVVLGGEADFQLTSLASQQTAKFIGSRFVRSYTFTASDRMPWFGTIRGRLGWAAGNALLYATAGVIYGRNDLGTTLSFDRVGSAAYSGITSSIRTGWTFGGGVEMMLSKSVSIRGEALYYDLGKTTIAAQNINRDPRSEIRAPFTENRDFNLGGFVGRVGINYRF